MRLYVLFFSILLCFQIKAQNLVVEYRSDSLFIKGKYVNEKTSKATLDNLLENIGKIKRSKDKDKMNPATGKKVIQTTYFYNALGLFFRKYDYDSTRLSIGIKLYKDTDPKEDRESVLSNIFSGSLLIGGNIINDKRQIAVLEKLPNISVTTMNMKLGSYNRLLGGDIIYGENVIRLMFDSKTDELTDVFIHHNFKDRKSS